MKSHEQSRLGRGTGAERRPGSRRAQLGEKVLEVTKEVMKLEGPGPPDLFLELLETYCVSLTPDTGGHLSGFLWTSHASTGQEVRGLSRGGVTEEGRHLWVCKNVPKIEKGLEGGFPSQLRS